MSTSFAYEGMASAFRESPWLASEDILGLGDYEVVIKVVEEHRNVIFEQGREKNRILVIGFENLKRKLVLNATNRKKIISYYGNKVSGWIDKKISLYVQDNIKVGKEIKCGIRIR